MSTTDDMVQRVARYVDDALPPEERTAFERDLQTDGALRRELELQRGVEDSIRRAIPYEGRPIRFETDPAAGTLRLMGTDADPAVRTSSQASRGVVGRLRWYAAAAGVLLVAAVAINVLVRERVPVVPPERVYTRLVQSGFAPAFVCTTDEEFEKAVRDRFGQGLLMRAAESVALVGWAYNNQYEGRLVGFQTLVLMAKVDGEPVIVLMDRASEDRSLSVLPESGLRLFRRQVGSLVCYEVTPRSEPAIVDRLHDPRAGG